MEISLGDLSIFLLLYTYVLISCIFYIVNKSHLLILSTIKSNQSRGPRARVVVDKASKEREKDLKLSFIWPYYIYRAVLSSKKKKKLK